MQLKLFVKPIWRFNNYILKQRYSTQVLNSAATNANPQETGEPGVKGALKKRPKDESNRSKLKMYGWQIHSYGDVDELQLTDKLKVPQMKTADECLVRVSATTVNPIDVAMLSKNFL